MYYSHEINKIIQKMDVQALESCRFLKHNIMHIFICIFSVFYYFFLSLFNPFFHFLTFFFYLLLLFLSFFLICSTLTSYTYCPIFLQTSCACYKYKRIYYWAFSLIYRLQNEQKTKVKREKSRKRETLWKVGTFVVLSRLFPVTLTLIWLEVNSPILDAEQQGERTKKKHKILRKNPSNIVQFFKSIFWIILLVVIIDARR